MRPRALGRIVLLSFAVASVCGIGALGISFCLNLDHASPHAPSSAMRDDPRAARVIPPQASTIAGESSYAGVIAQFRIPSKDFEGFFESLWTKEGAGSQISRREPEPIASQDLAEWLSPLTPFGIDPGWHNADDALLYQGPVDTHGVGVRYIFSPSTGLCYVLAPNW